MKENTLLKIALVCSLAGLFALYFISQNTPFQDYRPSSLNKNVGDDIKLTGKVTKIADKGDAVFVEVIYESPVNIVVFTDKNLTIKKDDSIEVLGEVQDYKGKEEIIVQKVRVVR